MVVLFEQFGSVVLIAGSCIFSVMTLLVLFKNISVSLFPQQASEEKASEENEPLSQEQIMKNYSEHYGFTPRETEVFEKLITTEDGVQEIADSLYVSRRVLQRYIAAIYEKTNTKSRIGLFQSLSKFGK